MVALFRRLRKPKRAADEEEVPSSEETVEPEPATERPERDVVDGPDPFPRKPTDPEGDPDTATDLTPGPATETVAVETVPPSPPPSAPEPVEAQTAPPTPAAIHPMPVALPPALPDADREAERSSSLPLGPLVRCFLCGTELSGAYCPTCRMTWKE